MKSSSITRVCLLTCTLLLSSCSANDPTKIVIITDYGDIELQLYDQTPQHRDNFVKLVKEGFYDGTLFHRVIKEFMIQGGDPDTKPGAQRGSGGPGYTVPAEIVPEYIHKRGALAAARLPDNINLERASSGSQFYIVHGKVRTDAELDRFETDMNQTNADWMFHRYLKEEEDAMQKAGQTVDPDSAQSRASRKALAWLHENPHHFKAEDREIYKTTGGAPHLDGGYTVFGEVTRGMNIVDKIAGVETGNANRPKTDVRIKRMRVK